MFHLNPNTGDPLPCAKADTCPYAPHYPTREEVRAYYESLMETRTYPAPKRKTTAPPLPRGDWRAATEDQAEEAWGFTEEFAR